MLKEILEQEILRQGYTIIKWKDTLKYGWGVEVEMDGFYTTIFVEDLAAEMICREMRAVSES